MALTEFGKAVRKARLDADENITTMANELLVSPAFLSGVETGRKKVPAKVVEGIANFFSKRGVFIEKLQELADVSNKSVSLEGLAPQQQMLIAGFARTPIDEETLNRMKELLATAQSGKGK